MQKAKEELFNNFKSHKLQLPERGEAGR